MYILKTSASFDSAHFLAGYTGKCANLHGHRWVIEVEAGRTHLQASGEKRGMVIDFADLKEAVRGLADAYDHAFIYEIGSLKETTVQALHDEGFRLIPVPFRPTAENFAKEFHDALKELGIPVIRVAVYETPDNCAVYEVS
ncbi:MAG: 6-carboxytetrahydropterin synthase [Oscillospiraceae bacterium]